MLSGEAEKLTGQKPRHTEFKFVVVHLRDIFFGPPHPKCMDFTKLEYLILNQVFRQGTRVR